MAKFDGIKKTTMEKVEWLYADDSTWSPSAGGDMMTGKVLFKKPTKQEELVRVEFNPTMYYIEYKEDTFVGLKESVDNGNNEIVVINSVEYYVRKVDYIWDGYLYYALLDIKND